jgi:hypothetical protein
MLRRTLALLALVALALAPRSAEAQGTPRRPPARAGVRAPGAAVVTVLAYRGPRDAVQTAAGFILPDGRVATALRPLAGATKLEVYTTGGDLLATVTALDAADVKSGIAVLPRLAQRPAVVAFARRVATVGDKVVVFLAQKGTTRGTAEQTVAAVETGSADVAVFRLGTAVVADGVGAPVLDARGEVVGMALGQLPARDERDLAVDVATIRRSIGKPGGRFALPARDGSVAALGAPADTARPGRLPGGRPEPARPALAGTPVASVKLRSTVVDLFGCVQTGRDVQCLLRLANDGRATKVEIEGGDLADSTRAKLAEAEAVDVGGTVVRVRGWRTKAPIELRELDATRFAVLFSGVAPLPDRMTLFVRIGGQGDAWLGPFAPTRTP